MERLPSTSGTSSPAADGDVGAQPCAGEATQPEHLPGEQLEGLPPRHRVDRRRPPPCERPPRHTTDRARRTAAVGPLAVHSRPGRVGGVADGPVHQAERQVVHRPARGDAHHPVAEPTRVVLDGGEAPGLDDLEGGPVTEPPVMASHARQPPWTVMSSAPATACGSQRKPLTEEPSASSTVPITSGAGTSSTNAPNAAWLERPHLDLERRAALVLGTRTTPGLGGSVARRTIR